MDYGSHFIYLFIYLFIIALSSVLVRGIDVYRVCWRVDRSFVRQRPLAINFPPPAVCGYGGVTDACVRVGEMMHGGPLPPSPFIICQGRHAKAERAVTANTARLRRHRTGLRWLLLKLIRRNAFLVFFFLIVHNPRRADRVHFEQMSSSPPCHAVLSHPIPNTSSYMTPTGRWRCLAR